MADRATIEYQLSLEDVIAALSEAFHRELARHVNWRRQRLISWAGGLAILAAFLVSYFIGMLSIWQLAIGVVACALLAAYPLLYFVPAKRTLKRHIVEANMRGPDKLAGRHKVTLTPDMVSDGTAAGEISAPWREVDEVTLAGRYLLVFASDPIIVPAAAFPGDSDFRAFAELARKYQGSPAAAG